MLMMLDTTHSHKTDCEIRLHNKHLKWEIKWHLPL